MVVQAPFKNQGVNKTRYKQESGSDKSLRQWPQELGSKTKQNQEIIVIDYNSTNTRCPHVTIACHVTSACHWETAHQTRAG